MYCVSHFFSVNMIFFCSFRPWGTIKYAWGLVPEGVHRDPCQLPDYIDRTLENSNFFNLQAPCATSKSCPIFLKLCMHCYFVYEIASQDSNHGYLKFYFFVYIDGPPYRL